MAKDKRVTRWCIIFTPIAGYVGEVGCPPLHKEKYRTEITEEFAKKLLKLARSRRGGKR